MNSIITFYSHDDEIARRTALANIAYTLSLQNRKVLIVDWVLEGTGLEKYFVNYKIKINGPGLLPMIMGVEPSKFPNYKYFLWEIKISNQHSISFMSNGKDQDKNYSDKLKQFDWDIFYKYKGGGSIY